MKISATIFSLALPLLSLPALANDALIKSYAETIAALNTYQQITQQLDKKCETKYALSKLQVNEIDFLLRKQANITFTEFVTIFGDVELLTLNNQGVANDFIEKNGGCIPSLLALFHADLHKVYLDEIAKLRSYQEIFIFGDIKKSEKELQAFAKEKVQNYQHLPIEEIKELARSLEIGYYQYSLASLGKIQINLRQATELLLFVVKQTEDPEVYHDLGRLMQWRNPTQAFNYFEKSAQLGDVDGLIWLGTYYSCNKDNVKALYWLNKASTGEPDYVEDIKLEIQDLGMPTNCLNGWPR
ncbi:sel1 repeat family protein [Thalassomonas actiniarum]|uniref:Sel1 repeat family protein n=1 Tax=Thalassomonas actiniarum TaxID=485447 RepID=A0AAF0C583_9GAMM|nr:sel1 repeat family protein [Thalassomonas actiniarum]WDE00826.1 sel1 repeat family protein [Thalassomonas actiniarum]